MKFYELYFKTIQEKLHISCLGYGLNFIAINKLHLTEVRDPHRLQSTSKLNTIYCYVQGCAAYCLRTNVDLHQI